MSVTFPNGHSYATSDFTGTGGYGYADVDAQTGLRRFPEGIMSELVALWSPTIIVPGTQFVRNNISGGYLRVPMATKLYSATIDVVTAPTGASLIVVIKLNPAGANTTLTTLTITASGLTNTQTVAGTSLAAGDLIGINVTQIGSTVPGSDLTVQLVTAL